MKFFSKSQLAVAILLAGGACGALAQEISSTIRGTVTDGAGNPITGSTVVITSTSGLTRTIETNSNGQFFVRGLPSSTVYDIVVSEEGYRTKRAEDLTLSVGQTSDLTFTLSDEAIEEVAVVASADLTSNVAVGPSAVFGLDTLRTAPAVNRNITDIIRADPRFFVNESNPDNDSIQCGGQNPRFNSITVDGMRLNDSFGLNASGYPTERVPFSFDAINQVAVEMAPFDVVYGGFTACNVNAVTKSGGNEFFGSVFYDYTDDSLKGDSLEGDDINLASFDESRFGFTVGGPIIEDKLSFFVAYEMLEGVNLFDRGPQGSGAVEEIAVTQAQLDEIVQIANDLYQYDPGAIPSAQGNEDEKLLVKLDWNISDSQRATFTYNYNDGFNIVQSDGDLNEFEFSNHLYERGAELNSFVAGLFSDWTDRFSTEVRLTHVDLDNRQLSLGGTDFGEIRVDTGDVDVYLGGDDSRQSNKLTYENLAFSFRGYLNLDDHQLTFGFEREELDVFNLFVQHTETEIRFGSIDDFRNGTPSAIYYNNAPDFDGDGISDPQDAAADWGYELNTLFVQDDWAINDTFTLTYGLRYDWYTSDDKPAENADFVASYGFSNSTNLDGADLLQPRIGFNWDALDTVTVRGGIGLFSGGNPNVWLSNNFSANNVLQFGQRGRNFGYTDGTRSLFDEDVVYIGVEDGLPNGPGYGIPQELYDAVAAGQGSNFEINYLDPNFEIPSEWKFALGATWDITDSYVLNADLLFTQGEDTAIILRGDLEQTGTGSFGYPEYDSVREPTFVLTNSDKGNESFIASFSLSKYFDFGLDYSIAYAYSDAKDIQPMTSSVAFSNYQNRAFFDPQEQVLSTSNYNIEHRFTFTLNWQKAFFGDNLTRVSFYSAANQGPSYSTTDPGNPNDIYGFTPFLEGNNVLTPGAERNSNDGSWWVKADIRVEQEFGGFMEDDKLSAFMVIDNFTNFLNDDWGILEQANFPGNVAVGEQAEARQGDTSLYEIRFGVNYIF